MAYSDAQKTKRLELERSLTPLTPAERFLLAALCDLRDADFNGNNIAGCEATVRQAEEAIKKEKKGINVFKTTTITLEGVDIVAGGPAVESLKNTLLGEQQ